MSPTEKPQFVALLTRAFRFAGKDISADPETVADWLDEFAEYPLAALDGALRRHRRESVYPPKPADIYRYLDGKAADDGRPCADEAWGMLLRFARDEAETGVMSEEMREAWLACGPILDEGDEVGARRCFISVYESHVRDARERHEPARWTVTLGTDKALRVQRVEQAVKLGRIGADQARALLPGPSTASLEQVAGLLEGPDAPPDALAVSQRLRELIEIINNAGSKADDQRKAEEAARREREQAERAKALRELAKRGVLPGGGPGEKTGEEAA